jgi:hypothetical protein
VTNFENFRNEKPNDHQMQNGETTATPTPRALFETIGQGAEEVNNIADDSEESQKLVEEIESMCINCEENVPYPSWSPTNIQGTTRLLLTKIPFFREVIIMSFSCPYCGTLLPLRLLTTRLLQHGNSKCRTNSTTRIKVHFQSHNGRRPRQTYHKIRLLHHLCSRVRL